jgi:hypothetical protein
MIRKLYPPVFFAIAALLVFWKVLFHPEFTLLTGGDTASSYFPWFDVASFWLKRGVLMLWDPYVYAGKLMMGEPQPGLFYPLNWVFMLLPAPGGGASLNGLQVLFILDYFLAGIFTYLLARSLNMSRPAASAAGIAFAYGGYVAPLYGYLNVLSGFVWMPLALYFFRRSIASAGSTAKMRSTIGAGACVALAFLPGHHIPAIHTGLLLFLYAAFAALVRWPVGRWRETIRSGSVLALTAGTAVLLTVFQWLPSAQWARAVFRWVGWGPPVRWGEKVPYSILQQTSNTSPQDGLSLVFPYISTGANLYTGGIVVFLALMAFMFVKKREPLFFGFAAVLYYFLSWGRYSALHGWVNTFIPGVWFARELFYYLVPMQLCLALLAGWGLDWIVASCSAQQRESFGRVVRIANWILAGIVLFAFSLVVALRLHKEMPMTHPFVTALGGLAAYLFVLGSIIFLLRTGRMPAQVFAGIMVFLILVDLGSHLSADIRLKVPAEGQENTYVRSYWKMPGEAGRLKRMRQMEFFRVDDPSGMFPPNYGDAWRLDATMGHGATALVDFLDFRGTGWGPFSNASALLNVRYIPSRIPIPGMERLPGNEEIYENPRAVPRAFVPQRFRTFTQRGQLLDWISTPLFNPRETVLFTRDAIEKVPEEFRRPEWGEDDDPTVRTVARLSAAERSAAAMPEKDRQEFLKYQPPAGWSTGDEIKLELDAAQAGQYFLFIAYAPESASEPVVHLELENAGERKNLSQRVPGKTDGAGRWTRACVDLGTLNPGNYTLLIRKDEQCTAVLDSFRITRAVTGSNAGNAGEAAVTSLKPNRVKVRARMLRPGFVVLSEVNYPGWEALVDGNPVPLLAGDHVLRAIPVPAGEHAIELRFRPMLFGWGLAVSTFALLLAGVFLWRTRAVAVLPDPDRCIDPDPARG